MKFKLSMLVSCILIALVSCSKATHSDDTTTGRTSSGGSPVPPNAILVDASKDGGAWWYPQYGNYSATAEHQGKALADYLRSLGYPVNELPQGKVVTLADLKPYKRVIRVGGIFGYLPEELAAYDAFLKDSSSLLFLNDHLANFPNDALSAHLGLNFTGAITGTVTRFVGHKITAQVTSLPYIAGSYIVNPNPDKITVLGYMQLPGADDTQVAVMGIIKHPTAKIFFMGDANGIQQVPQPFTKNLIAWLF